MLCVAISASSNVVSSSLSEIEIESVTDNWPRYVTDRDPLVTASRSSQPRESRISNMVKV